jgi:hypothetical protein
MRARESVEYKTRERGLPLDIVAIKLRFNATVDEEPEEEPNGTGVLMLGPSPKVPLPTGASVVGVQAFAQTANGTLVPLAGRLGMKCLSSLPWDFRADPAVRHLICEFSAEPRGAHGKGSKKHV